jgi:hypothetical protein
LFEDVTSRTSTLCIKIYLQNFSSSFSSIATQLSFRGPFALLVKMSGQQTANMAQNDSTNRYSMPVTRSRSYNIAELNLDSSIDGNNTTGFLFGDEDATNGDSKSFNQANNVDSFSTLVRNAGFPSMVSSAPIEWTNGAAWAIIFPFSTTLHPYPLSLEAG